MTGGERHKASVGLRHCHGLQLTELPLLGLKAGIGFRSNLPGKLQAKLEELSGGGV